MDGSIKQTSARRIVLALAWLSWAVLCAPWAAVHAATPVGADITASTTWRLADAPYVVSGDVAVAGNAVLAIEPGVEVRFEDGASLRVERGTLSAQGTSAQPIVFTSIHDDGQGTPAPGDWGALTFLRDTHDASTMLSHVRVRYGQGIVVEGASPTFNNVRIENSAGPAIALDLSSSPRGQGLEASGNLLNGILVPAGEIDTDVVWALRGIPYVLAQGTIHVGKSTFGLAPSQLQLITGVLGVLEVTIPDPAPEGGLAVDIVSSVPSVAGVPPVVVVNEGERSAQVEVQANARGTSIVSASAAGFGTVTATVHVIEPPALSLTPSQSVISIENGGQVAVWLSDVAPASGREISLAVVPEGVIEVPAMVVVPPGASSVAFDVAGLALGTATLTASAQGYVPASGTVRVRPVSLNPPATLLVAPGLTRSMPILLTDPAPASGLTISLESSNAAVATVPASVNVPAGASSVNIDVQGIAAGTAQVTASAPGYEPGTTQVRVESVTIQLQPAGTISVPQGLEAERSVRISSPAPEGGAWITVQTLDAAIASAAPASVFVPEGQTLATSTLALKGEAEGSTQLQLSSPGLVQAQAAVNVGPPARLEFSRATVVVGKGLNTYINEVYVRRRSGTANYAPTTPLTVTLTSTDPGKVGVPVTVTIPAGQFQVAFPVSGLELSGEPVPVGASAPGYVSTQTPLMATVVTPQLQFPNLDGSRGVGGANDDFYLQWHVAGATYSTSQTAISDQTIALSIEEASPEGLVAGFLDRHGNATTQVVIAEGRSDSHGSYNQQYTYVGTPTMAGTYKVGASLPGIGTWASGTQTVVGAQLEFSRATIIAGHGLATYSYEVNVRLRANGQNAPTAEPLAVTLTSADPGKVGVPATVTIPAGQYQTRFSISGLEPTSEAVAIEASAPGYVSTQTPLMATVVTPQLQFVSLDGSRGVGGVNDNFYLQWHVAGTTYPGNHTALSDQTIVLSIEEASPEGLVAGFLDRHGNATTQVVIAEGRSDSHGSNNQQYTYVGTPTMAGTYKVGASLPGIGTWASGTQTVVVPELRFSRSAVVVGKGMDTYAYEVYLRQTVNGSTFYGATAVTVSLNCASSAVCTVPATATIPAGQYQTTLVVTGTGLGATKVIPSATGYVGVQELDVTTITPQLALSGIPASLGAGATANFSVSLHTPGADYPNNQTAAVPIPIDLTSAQPSVATVPAQITVSAGSRTASATLTATGAGTTTVTASGVDLVPATSGTITVQQP